MKYDSFFDPIGLESYLTIPQGDLCVDFYSLRPNNRNCRYLLTTDILPYKCIREFALSEKPIEANVIDGLNGNGIYLYDLSERGNGGKTDRNTIQSISYRLQMFRPALLKKYLAAFVVDKLGEKIKSYFKCEKL